MSAGGWIVGGAILAGIVGGAYYANKHYRPVYLYQLPDGKWTTVIRFPDGNKKMIGVSTKDEVVAGALAFHAQEPPLSSVMLTKAEQAALGVSFKTVKLMRVG